MGNTPAIRLSNITKTYGSNQVLKNISLSIERGRFYSLLGRNGAGKSTLLRILMGYEDADFGHGEVLGTSLSGDRRQRQAKVGYACDTFDISLPTSVADFVKFYSGFYPSWDNALFSQICGDLMIPVGKNFRELSKGQRMQVAFAAAVAIKPTLLLLDEITSVLDAHARAYCMKLLQEFRDAGGTVLLATNIVFETHGIADELLFLDGGQLKLQVQSSELSDLFQKLRRPTGAKDSIFDHRECVCLGSRPGDDSLIYLIRKDTLKSIVPPERYLDPEKVTPEEAFLFLTTESRG